MKHHLVLRVIAKLLIPSMLLFALYVQFHGDFGPGGGFQAGVIFAAGIILYGIIFGLRAAQKVVPPEVVQFLVGAGLLLYALVGVFGILWGSTYLDYDVLAKDPVAGQHYGILAIEFGVGVTVAAVMITIFYGFAGRGRQTEGDKGP